MEIANLLSSPAIPVTTAALGAAVFLCVRLASGISFPGRFETTKVFYAWMSVEVLCYLVVSILEANPFPEYWSADTAVIYGYLYSCSSIIFMISIIRNSHLFHRRLVIIFLLITLISVPYWAFVNATQNSFSTWGGDFYYSYGALLDGAYFAVILILEIIMLVLGIVRALDDFTYNDPQDGLRV